MIDLRKRIAAANLLPALFCLSAIVINNSIFRLGWLGPVWTASIVLVLAAITLLAPRLDVSAEKPGRLTYPHAALGLVAVAPVLASLLLGWNREYPYGGDQSFHLKHIFYLLNWWASSPGTPSVHDFPGSGDLRPEHFQHILAKPWHLLWCRAFVMIVIVAITVWCYRRSRLWALVFASATLLSWGSLESSIYFRYPAGGYWLPMVFALPSYALGNIELASRVPNVLAPVVWLFVLRPWLIGHWPDLKIMPIAILLLWNKDALFYFDSAYIESWALIFSLLAVELIVVRGPDAAPLACLLVGSASCIKEPFIFALPFIWLAGTPWRVAQEKALALTGVALAAGWPFILYYAARKSVAIEFRNFPQPVGTFYFDRTVPFDFSLGGFVEYIKAYWFNSITAFGGTTIFPSIVASIGVVMLRGRRSLPVASVIGAGVFLLLFFAVDLEGRATPAYFRFLLFALPFLLAGIVSLGDSLAPQLLIVVVTGILLVQFPSAYIGAARSAQGSTDRNFTEFYDRPIVFPIKFLLAEARRKGILPRDATVYVNRPDITVKTIPGVSDNMKFGPLGELYCKCTAEHPNIMALFVRYANMNLKYADAPPLVPGAYGPSEAYDRFWRSNRAERGMCLAQMQKTCRNFLSRSEGDEVVGALGVR